MQYLNTAINHYLITWTNWEFIAMVLIPSFTTSF